VEDARACLDLLKQKCARGTMWGTREASSESIFRRLGRALRPAKQAPSGYATPRAGAVIDWGRPERGVGAPAAVCVGCRSDDEVVQGVRKAVLGAGDAALADVDMDVPADGVDFVWARLRELELARGWSSGKPGRDGGSSGPQPSSAPSPPQQQRQDENGEGGGVSTPLPPPSLDSASGAESEQVVSDALRSTVRQIAAVYDCLPPCTAFIVYSGSGDPRQMSRLQAQQQQFRHEFRTKKWDEVSVRWTDAEDQQLHQAVKRAREGMAMITVK
jgi:RNA exonuclease 1